MQYLLVCGGDPGDEARHNYIATHEGDFSISHPSDNIDDCSSKLMRNIS